MPSQDNTSGRPSWIGLAVAAMAAPVMAIFLYGAARGLERDNGVHEARAQLHRVGARLESLSFQSLQRSARVCSTDQHIVDVARGHADSNLDHARLELEIVRRTCDAEVAYVMNRDGLVVAGTEYEDGKSFEGNTYLFRPYFTEPMKTGQSMVYPAVGVTTGQRGIYFASPITCPGDNPVGVVVLKWSAERLDELLRESGMDAVLVSPEGIVFAASDSAWLLTSAQPLDGQARMDLLARKQFGGTVPDESPFRLRHDRVDGPFGSAPLVDHPVQMGARPGWRLVCVQAIPEAPLAANQSLWLAVVSLAIGVLLLTAGFSGVLIRRLRGSVRSKACQLENTNRQLLHEVTDRQQAEQEARDNACRLREIIDYLPDATFVINLDGEVLAWNRAIAALTGVPASQVLGKGDHAHAIPIYGCRRPILADLVLNETAELPSRYSLLDKSEETLVAETFIPSFRGVGAFLWGRARPIRDVEGRVVGAIETIRDVTHMKQAERELAEARDAAEAASRSKTEFLANMSHEIRTPMTAILGFADMIDEHRNEPETVAQSVDTIRRNGKHLLAIINDILDLSKIESGKLEVVREPVDLVDLLGEVVALIQPRADQKDLQVSVDYETPVPGRIRTDLVRVRQILLNLLGNAIKFTQTGSVRVAVALQGEAGECSDGPMLQIRVIDTGIGISPEKARHIFDAFSQADTSTSRQFGGTGLGLTVSRSLARRLGGEITVHSELGTGSTFTLTLDPGPVDGLIEPDKLRVGEPSPSQAKPAPTAGQVPALQGRVLLAEDGKDNQRLIAALLRKTGLEVTVVCDGLQAREAASHAMRSGEVFDLVLMDMQMPVMDGYEATRQLVRSGCPFPVVALTAHAMVHDADKCKQAGCVEFLTKPIERERFYAVLARYCPAASAAPADQPS